MFQNAKTAKEDVSKDTKLKTSLPNNRYTVTQARDLANRVQTMVEAALAVLLEHRLKCIGVLEVFLPQQKIQTINGTAAIASIYMSGMDYFMRFRLPDKNEKHLLGYCAVNDLVKFDLEMGC